MNLTEELLSSEQKKEIEIQKLKAEIRNLELICHKLEAERDAHLEVIRRIFQWNPGNKAHDSL